MSDIYYKVRKNTEAGKAIEQFFEDEAKYKKALMEAAIKLGGKQNEVYTYSNGQLAGIGFDDQPEGWKKTKHWGCYLPYAKNKEVWSMFPETKDFSGSALAELLLNKVPCSFKGLSMRTGCSLTTVNDIYYVNHTETKGVKPKLKGMRKIKESTFIKETKEQG